MNYEPIIYNGTIDLGSDLTKQQTGNALIQLIKPVIEEIIENVHQNVFDFSTFQFR